MHTLLKNQQVIPLEEQIMALPSLAYHSIIPYIADHNIIASTNDTYHRDLITHIATHFKSTPLHDITSYDGNTLKRSMYSGRVISNMKVNILPQISNSSSKLFISIK